MIKDTESSVYLINHYDSSSFSNINLQDINSVSDVLQLNNQTAVLLENIAIDSNALVDNAQQAFTESDFEVNTFDDQDEKLDFDQANSDSLQQAINACTKSIEVLPSSDELDNHHNEVFDEADYCFAVFEDKNNLVDSLGAIIDGNIDDDHHYQHHHEEEVNDIKISLNAATSSGHISSNNINDNQNIVDVDRKIKGKICGICGKVCQNNFRLKMHMTSHSTNKPFKCPFEGCTKEFKSKIGLKEHEAKHTGNNLRFFCLNYSFI